MTTLKSAILCGKWTFCVGISVFVLVWSNSAHCQFNQLYLSTPGCLCVKHSAFHFSLEGCLKKASKMRHRFGVIKIHKRWLAVNVNFTNANTNRATYIVWLDQTHSLLLTSVLYGVVRVGEKNTFKFKLQYLVGPLPSSILHTAPLTACSFFHVFLQTPTPNDCKLPCLICN